MTCHTTRWISWARATSATLLFVFCSFAVATNQTTATAWSDHSPHETRFVTVNGVTLHYLDWGGHGDTLLFLAGLGNTAHIFDDLAPRFTCCFRVLAYTRRGFGLSDKPAAGYDVTSRRADLEGFVSALHLGQVNLVGHSIAGDELADFAAHYPEQVHTLVFLDATYDHSSMPVAAANAIDEALGKTFDSRGAMSSWERFSDYQKHLLDGAWARPWEADLRDAYVERADNTIQLRNSENAIAALRQGSRQAHMDFGQIRVKSLAIMAISDPIEGVSFKERAKYQRYADEITNWKAEQRRVVKRNPNIRLVLMKKTNHYCFLQRPQQVTDEMINFFHCRLSKRSHDA